MPEARVARGVGQWLGGLWRPLNHAWRRATLVPLRLAALCLGLLGVLAVLGWNLHSTRALLARQAEASRFMGEPGWRVGWAPVGQAELGRRRWLHDGPALQGLAEQRALLWLHGTTSAVRAPDQSAAEYRSLAFASAATGLAERDASGATPCSWIGPRPPAGPEWVINQRLRCRVAPVPPGWLSLNAEVDQAVLVLPLAVAPMVAGTRWHQQAETLLLAGVSPCDDAQADAHQQALLRCRSLSANRSAQAEAGETVGRWNRWALPAALMAAWGAVLVYLQGLQPLLQQEFALRIALGRGEWAASRWLLGATTAQLAWVGLGLAAPAWALLAWMQLGLTPWEQGWLGGWAGLCLLTGSAWVAATAWRSRGHSLQMLGRLT